MGVGKVVRDVRYVLCVENVVSGVDGGGCFDCDDCGG